MLIAILVLAGLVTAAVVSRALAPTIEQRAELYKPLAYVTLLRSGRSPDISSFGAIGSRTVEARGAIGWVVWRFGASAEGTAWRSAYAWAREQINDAWSPDVGDVLIGIVTQVVTLITAATGNAAAIAAWIANTVRTVATAYEVKASEAARMRAILEQATAESDVHLAEVDIFQSLIGERQPSLDVLRDIANGVDVSLRSLEGTRPEDRLTAVAVRTLGNEQAALARLESPVAKARAERRVRALEKVVGDWRVNATARREALERLTDAMLPAIAPDGTIVDRRVAEAR